VDEDVPASGCPLRLADGRFEVADVGDVGPSGELGARLVPAEDEDRHTVVMVAVPSTRGFEGAPSGQHRPGGEELLEDLAIGPGQAVECLRVVPGLVSVGAQSPTFVRLGCAPTDASSKRRVDRHAHPSIGRFYVLWQAKSTTRCIEGRFRCATRGGRQVRPVAPPRPACPPPAPAWPPPRPACPPPPACPPMPPACVVL
jgi:hypothetical protein